VGWYSMGRALYHLAVADALRHHFCRPYSCLELLGPALCLKPGNVLVVRLGRSGVVVADVVPGGVFPRDPHVPQHARGLGDLPLAVVGHKADLGVFAPTVVCRADLPPGGSPGTPSSASACPCPWPPVTAGRMVKGTTGSLTWPALPT
jgi:hypothetical protein